MRAAVFRRRGPPSVLQVSADQPKPKRTSKHVLVSVWCSSVNPIDLISRSGQVPGVLVPKLLGRDFSGVVLESDEGSAFPPGTKVYGFTEWYHGGAYAELLSVPEDNLAAMPSNLTFEQAAALPLTAVTGWQALDAAALQQGQRVLIHAGAGGVGSIAIQLAKARGLHVTTTCSGRNIEFVKEELGADEAVDYTAQRFEEVYVGRPFDAIIDVVGGSYESRGQTVLKRHGAYVSIGNSGWIKKYGNIVAAMIWLYKLAKGKLLSMLGLGPRFHLIMVRPRQDQLAALRQLVEKGRVKPVIDRVLPLEQVSEAHAYVEQGHTKGKVVLRIKDGP